MADTFRIAQLLNETFNSDGQVVHNAAQQLDCLSAASDFPLTLLSIVNGDENQGQKIAAATYLKNLIRRNVFGEGKSGSFSKEFKEKLLESLLRAEFPVLRVLVEAFSFVVDADFVKKNEWHELVPQVRYAIQNSDIISGNANSGLKTLNALKALQTLLRPFQYFLNPKVAKEPVPPLLEQIANDILVPLLAIFHGFAEKALATKGSLDTETENVILIVCKCTYYAVRSYMPTSVATLLPSFSGDLCGLLQTLNLEDAVSSEGSQQVRLETGKRILLMFCALVTRHRKYADKLMPDIMKCVLRIARCSSNISKLDCLSERVISLAFDVISHILETGPGWRLVSPHFSSLLDLAIFPALMMNAKDILEWEEDADEFLSKNLPSELEEISGWREDLFIARKSAMNLLGVISMSKGPPVVANSSLSSLKRKQGDKKKGKDQRCSVGELLVLPFLSKFPLPSDANASDVSISNNYYGVLMGYGALQDFLGEQKPERTATLIRQRVLPLYKVSITHPYLLAAANWILGELASSLPEDMAADVYSALLKALTIPDCKDVSCYPVRASAAGAVIKILESDYLPPDWLPILQVVVGRIGHEEEEIPMLFQLLSSVVEAGEKDVAVHVPLVVSQLADTIAKYMPSNIEPWPQAVIKGFAALSVMAKSWLDAVPEEEEQNYISEKWESNQRTMARAFSALLQQAWLVTKEISDDDDDTSPHSCIDDASTMLWFIIRSSTNNDALLELKVSELLLAWTEIIADWHSWEEVEDLAVFDCIKEVVNLEKNLGLPNLFIAKMPPPPAPPVPEKSLIENIATFVSEAILQYPSAASRACACVHTLLHLPCYSSDTEEVRRSLVIAFSQAAASRFKDIQSKPCSLWKPLLLAVSSCYLYYPDAVQSVLEKVEKGGYILWVSAVNSISSISFTPNTTAESEIKLVVITLGKVVEQLLTVGSPTSGLLWECFSSLLSAFARLKEIQEANDLDEEIEDVEETGNEEEEESDDDDDEDSVDDVQEETEEEFLERYAEAAAALANGNLAEEGDLEDFDEELELGSLEELDPQIFLQSLLETCHQSIVQNQVLSPQLISSLRSLFPEFTGFGQ